MTSRHAALLATLTLAFAPGPLPADAVPEREAYAWRFPLAGGEGAEFRAAVIPAAVYRSVTDPGLRDIGVYNAAGQAVPRSIEAPPDAPAPAEKETALGLVPLYGPPVAQREQLRLLMQQRGNGTTLSLDARAGNAPDAGDGAPPLTAYLVDLRALDEPLEALRFDWGESAAGFIGTVRVETGDDLQQWRRLGRGTLAHLEYQDTRIEQDRVRLAGTPGKYLRITWSDLPDDWNIRSLSGIRSAEAAPETRERLELERHALADDGRTLLFDAGGFPPVDRVNLLLPDENVVLRARILYREADREVWREAHEGVFYHVSRDGRTVQSEPAAVAGVRARHWKVRVESGAISEGLRLQLGWRPERLLFLAQGGGPFELATGRARDRIEHYPQQRLLGDPAIFQMLRDAGTPAEAVLGARELLAGEAALALDYRTRWRTVLVWAGLIGAVLLVAWLVLSLLREMKS